MPLRRTAVYLSDEQRDGLKEASHRLGRSEADLMREGVDLLLLRYRGPLGTCDLPTGTGGRLADHVDQLLADGFGRYE